MQHQAKARKQLLDEINITPLTDVFLVLLIIMMVVAPMLKMSRNEITMPRVDGGDPIDKSRLVVEITANGMYFVDGQAVAEEGLADALTASIGKFEEKNVVIRADRYTKGNAVIKVFDAAREAKFERMTVAVETLTAERDEELQKFGNGPTQNLPPLENTAIQNQPSSEQPAPGGQK